MDYITTYTGEDIKPLAPNSEQIHIEDIAHALSLLCRANGHFIRFYSVAQHSINCAKEAEARGLSPKIQVACLLHDASEAYLSDLTTPVKSQLPKYQKIEKHLQSVIYCVLLGCDLNDDETTVVKQIDHDMLVYEFNVLMKKKIFDENPKISSAPNLDFCDFGDVEKEFIRLYQTCSNKFLR